MHGLLSVFAGGRATITASWSAYTFSAETGGDPNAICNTGRIRPSEAAPMMVIPRVDSVSPDRALIGQPVDVTIRGLGFGRNPRVSAGNGISVVINSASDTQISARFNIAANDQGGNHAVLVTSSTGEMSNDGNFFVQIPGSLRVVSVDTIRTGTFGNNILCL
ncbi:MAG: IPT/TIG domain-containing protein [Pyrinomonadaceae bacterium]